MTTTKMPKRYIPKPMVLANGRYWLSYLVAVPENNLIPRNDISNITTALEHTAKIDSDVGWTLTKKLVNAISPILERQSPLKEWEQFLLRSIERAKTQNDQAGELGLLLAIAALQYQRRLAPQARQSYRRAFFVGKALDDDHGQAIALSNLANLYRRYGNFWRAILLCQKALVLFESFDDRARLAATENHLGLVYLSQRDWALAEEHFFKAKSLYEQEGKSPYRLAKTLHNIGELYFRMEKWPLALKYLERAGDLYHNVGDQISQARIYLNQGNVYLHQGNLFLAHDIYDRCEQALRSAGGGMFDLGQVFHNLGLVHTALKNWANGIGCFERALECWAELNEDWHKLNTLSDYIALYIKWGDKRGSLLLKPAEQILKEHPEARFDSLRQTLARQARLLAEDDEPLI